MSLNEEVRRALYGQSLSTIDLENYLPDLIGPTEILSDDFRKQFSKHLPARVEGILFLYLMCIWAIWVTPAVPGFT